MGENNMWFASSSFTVELLFRIAWNDDEIFGFSLISAMGFAAVLFPELFIKCITELQEQFFKSILEA